MTVNSKIFSISTLNTIEHGPLTLNIKPHLDPLVTTDTLDVFFFSGHNTKVNDISLNTIFTCILT